MRILDPFFHTLLTFFRANVILSSGGVTSVVTMTIITTLVKYSASSKPDASPVEAMMSATSPLEIMPAPIAIEEERSKPVNRAPAPPPKFGDNSYDADDNDQAKL